MKLLKRVEIVTLSIKAPSLCKKFKAVGVPGYTIIPDVHGSGNRGLRMSDELTGVSQNCMILIACEEDMLEKILAVIQPVLKDYGGICLISDTLYLKH